MPSIDELQDAAYLEGLLRGYDLCASAARRRHQSLQRLGLRTRRNRMPLHTPIQELNLSYRAFNALYRAGIYTVGEADLKLADVRRHIPGLGPKSRKEVLAALLAAGHYQAVMRWRQ